VFQDARSFLAADEVIPPQMTPAGRETCASAPRLVRAQVATGDGRKDLSHLGVPVVLMHDLDLPDAFAAAASTR
jgi:hypothetical protein